MLGRLYVKQLSKPNINDIKLMSKAALEILNYKDNWRGKNDRELNWAYDFLDERKMNKVFDY